MKKLFIVLLILSTSNSFAADTKKKVARTPQNALSIELGGYYISPSHDPAGFELQGKHLKTHLTSRFTGKNGKLMPLSVTLNCESDDKCYLELSQ